MEPETLHAPPVVAVVVVHEPGDWFEQTLDALAAQDYPNLRFLFLLAEPSAVAQAHAAALSSGGDESGKVAFEAHLETVIKLRIPKAFVRSLGANPGFGAAANEVGRLVEGQNGFFLFCHDDIAPEPDAVRLLVEELYRSNAGVVGPKFVEWDEPGVLQAVGLGLDRFGELHQVIEPGEIDQEQHDGVRDVFVLSSACLLVRADLFREIGGFDPAIDFWGDDVEFCWRVHHSGARVVVAPVARVRHRGRLVERRPDIAHLSAQARHRMRTVMTMTGRARLPGRLVELILLTLSELVVGLFTGRFRSGVASTRALVGLIPRSAGIVRRRREVAATRRVPEREVLGLQERGSARLTSFFRNRDMSTFVGAESSVRRWRESTTAPVFVWIGVLAALLFGSRAFVTGAVPSVGEFLPFVDSPRELFSSYASGWNPNGLGSSSANPTGWATLSVLSTVTLFRMGLLQTVFVIGLVVVGLIGLWKLAGVFPSSRARLGALLVYAASPLVSGAMAIGSLSTLVSYAAAPWIVHTLRSAVGVGTADPRLAETDLVDGIVELDLADRIRKTLQVGLVVGLATAFVPLMLIVALVIGVLLAIATLLAMAPWRTALRYLEATAAGVVIAALLNLPWITSWSWAELVGPSPVGDPGRGLLSVASFEVGPTDFVSLWLVLYLPVVAAIVLARAWRLTWAIRAGVLVVGFGALAVLGDRGGLPLAMPEAGVLLAPIGVGLAVSAAAALAAFDLDVRGGTFGWRQPLGLLASAAVVVGLVPGIYATGDGGWNAPTTTLAALVDLRLPDADQAGDYHVLVLGDARILPTPGVVYRDGMSFSVIDDDGMDVRDRWFASSTRGDEVIAEALDRIASGSTQRAGRLLAPLGIRFVIIPLFDGVISTPASPLEPPAGLQTALDEQLDIVSFPDLPTVDIYQNTAWIPTASLLTGATAEASTAAGDEALVRADLTEAEPAFVGVDHTTPRTQEIPAGVVHLAVPFDGNWTLSVDGVDLDGRRAFGITTAFDVPSGGDATLEYDSSSTRSLWVAVQVVLWLIVLVGAARVTVPSSRRRLTAIEDETLISLDDAAESAEPSAAFDPGLDLTGQVARIGADLPEADQAGGVDLDVAPLSGVADERLADEPEVER
ncbi:MAG: glycosyltransferase [Ilumatobacter sp.]|uniref:glycosyltransferase n=1 Tax=Ilumatobacter sp. TaxID=1967498 RepID=UPI00391B38C8